MSFFDGYLDSWRLKGPIDLDLTLSASEKNLASKAGFEGKTLDDLPDESTMADADAEVFSNRGIKLFKVRRDESGHSLS